jgi:hypothetical protein
MKDDELRSAYIMGGINLEEVVGKGRDDNDCDM